MNKTKYLCTSVTLSLIFAILMSVACFDAKCDTIRDNVLRLHILANSDSEHDQQIKLKVRDAVLKQCKGLFNGVNTAKEAEQIAKENLTVIATAAQTELDRLGCDYGLSVEVAPTDFGTREYEQVTLPAGEYMAVRILLGEAKGKNWWCVCFPNMCLTAAGEQEEISRVLDESGTKIVTQSEKFKVKFKIVELYEAIRSRYENSKQGQVEPK